MRSYTEKRKQKLDEYVVPALIWYATASYYSREKAIISAEFVIYT